MNFPTPVRILIPSTQGGLRESAFPSTEIDSLAIPGCVLPRITLVCTRFLAPGLFETRESVRR